jgi:hypothetical protein
MTRKDAPKQRHGCATAWLTLMVASNTGVPIMILARGDEIRRQVPDYPDWAMPAGVVACLLNIVFILALFAWQKWGFYGLVAMSALGFAMNLAAGLGAQAAVGLVGIVILFLVLQIGGERSTWKQLE